MKELRLRLHPLLALLLVLSGCLAWAQPAAKPNSTPVLMWKVSSKTSSAYVLGSVHLSSPSMYPLPAVIENAFKSSSVLVVEVDLTKVDQQGLKELMAAAGSYPPGDSLSKHIAPETLAKLNQFLDTYALPREVLANSRPWMVSMVTAMLPLIADGADPNDGIDYYFLKRAGSKRIDQLEDAAFQIKLLKEYPESASDYAVLSGLKEAERSRETMAKLSSYWVHGEGNKIEALMTELSADDPPEVKAFQFKLREGRNPHMADRLEKCLQSKESCFMVVGAAHVIGKEGIVSLMQARGYTAEQAMAEEPAAARPAK